MTRVGFGPTLLSTVTQCQVIMYGFVSEKCWQVRSFWTWQTEQTGVIAK